ERRLMINSPYTKFDHSSPVTAGGRMFTAVILLAGIAIVAAPAGLVATALRRAGEETKEDERS
ncbi:MAG: hypothetical protein OXU63_03670, partial [Acidobacteriota bacterium]|nr:hypothetical protein [Acidobacteriota bacterium]